MKPPNSEGRPAGNGPADESLSQDTSSVRAAADFLAQLAACSGPDDPAFKAATLLADAWQPALDRSYRLGYENGYTAGLYEAERDIAAAWARAAKPIREVLAQPTYAELQRRRGEAS